MSFSVAHEIIHFTWISSSNSDQTKLSPRNMLLVAWRLMNTGHGQSEQLFSRFSAAFPDECRCWQKFGSSCRSQNGRQFCSSSWLESMMRANSAHLLRVDVQTCQINMSKRQVFALFWLELFHIYPHLWARGWRLKESWAQPRVSGSREAHVILYTCFWVNKDMIYSTTGFHLSHHRHCHHSALLLSTKCS